MTPIATDAHAQIEGRHVRPLASSKDGTSEDMIINNDLVVVETLSGLTYPIACSREMPNRVGAALGNLAVRCAPLSFSIQGASRLLHDVTKTCGESSAPCAWRERAFVVIAQCALEEPPSQTERAP